MHVLLSMPTTRHAIEDENAPHSQLWFKVKGVTIPNHQCQTPKYRDWFQEEKKYYVDSEIAPDDTIKEKETHWLKEP
eukprot:1156351-Pelagomonas_calceolata.AAC.6